MNDFLTQDDSIPLALEFPISIGNPNESITIYEGQVTFEHNERKYEAKGHIFLKWLPNPVIWMDVSEISQNQDKSSRESLYIHLDHGTEDLPINLDNGTEIRLSIMNTKTSRSLSNITQTFSGRVIQKVFTTEEVELQYILFLLPNFPKLVGRRVHFFDKELNSDHDCLCRLILYGGGWIITLDGDGVHKGKEVETYLQNNSGFGITHVGRLEREDGKLFTSEEAKEVLDALAGYLSFASGRWTAPCLLLGFDSKGNQAWQTWDPLSRIVAFSFRLSWLDKLRKDQFENPFPGFLKLWQNNYWQDVIKNAIVWYVEANDRVGFTDGAIISTQAAFELLSSAILVEQYKWLSEDGYEKIPAADRIRLLFKWADIPTNIPVESDALNKRAKEFNWSDTATAMTEIRNKITHPTKKSRKMYDKHGDDARFYALHLGLWNLELVLLRLFEYEGTYSNRLKKNKYAGDVEQVPWLIPKR